jgi:hypothetical protein
MRKENKSTLKSPVKGKLYAICCAIQGRGSSTRRQNHHRQDNLHMSVQINTSAIFSKNIQTSGAAPDRKVDSSAEGQEIALIAPRLEPKRLHQQPQDGSVVSHCSSSTPAQCCVTAAVGNAAIATGALLHRHIQAGRSKRSYT